MGDHKCQDLSQVVSEKIGGKSVRKLHPDSLLPPFPFPTRHHFLTLRHLQERSQTVHFFSFEFSRHRVATDPQRSCLSPLMAAPPDAYQSSPSACFEIELLAGDSSANSFSSLGLLLCFRITVRARYEVWFQVSDNTAELVLTLIPSSEA